MLNRRSLDPEQRTLYGANLQPPSGYVFDAAVATTLSLDFETALAVPVSLALFAAEKGMEIGTNGVQLLGGHGFVKEHPMERWYRHLRAIAIMEGGLLV